MPHLSLLHIKISIGLFTKYFSVNFYGLLTSMDIHNCDLKNFKCSWFEHTDKTLFLLNSWEIACVWGFHWKLFTVIWLQCETWWVTFCSKHRSSPRRWDECKWIYLLSGTTSERRTSRSLLHKRICGYSWEYIKLSEVCLNVLL